MGSDSQKSNLRHSEISIQRMTPENNTRGCHGTKSLETKTVVQINLENQGQLATQNLAAHIEGQLKASKGIRRLVFEVDVVG